MFIVQHKRSYWVSRNLCIFLQNYYLSAIKIVFSSEFASSVKLLDCNKCFKTFKSKTNSPGTLKIHQLSAPPEQE